MAERIPMDQMEPRRIYKLRSRNLLVGVWDAEAQGFIGIRHKFDSAYLFTEYHTDTGPPLGTATPYQALGLLSEEVEVKELFWDAKPEPPPPGRRAYAGPAPRENQPLFDYLKPLNDEIIEQRRRENKVAMLEAESKRWAPQTKAEYDQEQRVAKVREWYRAEQAVMGLIEDPDERREAQKQRHREWVERLQEAIRGE